MFSRKAVSGQGDILGQEWTHVFAVGVGKQSDFCTSPNDALKRGHLLKQIMLLIIMLQNYEWAGKLEDKQHTTSRLSFRIHILSFCDFWDRTLFIDLY